MPNKKRFMLAAIEGNLAQIKDSLSTQAELVRARFDEMKGATALLLAAACGHTQVVTALLACDANLEEKNDDGFTALLLAAFNGRTETVECLLKHGASSAEESNDGITALMLAVKGGHTATAACLRMYEVSSGLEEAKKRMVELRANEKGLVTQTEELQAKLERINKGFGALVTAAFNGETETVQWLLTNDASKTSLGGTALQAAALNGHTETVKCFLRHGADPMEKDNRGHTALHVAASNGHKETVECLLIHRADPAEKDSTGTPVLLIAALNGHTATVGILLAHGENSLLAGKNKQGITALLAAALNGHTETVEYLLAHGADLAEKSNLGSTALLLAAFSGHTTTVECLLTHGASLGEKDDSGQTALLLATRNGQMKTVEWLARNFWFAFTPEEIALVTQNVSLFSNTTLPESFLFRRYFADEFQGITHALESQKSLTLCGQTLTAPQLVVLLHLLRCYPNIKRLEIRQCVFQIITTVLPAEIIALGYAPLDRPFELIVQGCNLDDSIFLALSRHLIALTGLLHLDISHNRLGDVSAQYLVDQVLPSCPGLQTLDISHNQLTCAGVRMVLKCCKIRLSTLNVSYNWLFIQSENAQTELLCLLEKTEIQTLDLSANYLCKSTKPHFGNDLNHFFCTPASELTPRPSLLRADDVNINYANWVVYLLRNTQCQDTEHTKLLIEGMYKFGQYFLLMCDFRPKNDLLGSGTVETKFFNPEQTARNIEDFRYKCYSVPRILVKKLLAFIETDKEKDLFYNKKGVPSSSKGQVYNCYTWALAKLIEAGIEKAGSEPNLVALPSLYLRQQQVVQPIDAISAPESYCYIL